MPTDSILFPCANHLALCAPVPLCCGTHRSLCQIYQGYVCTICQCLECSKSAAIGPCKKWGLLTLTGVRAVGPQVGCIALTLKNMESWKIRHHGACSSSAQKCKEHLLVGPQEGRERLHLKHKLYVMASHSSYLKHSQFAVAAHPQGRAALSLKHS